VGGSILFVRAILLKVRFLRGLLLGMLLLLCSVQDVVQVFARDGNSTVLFRSVEKTLMESGHGESFLVMLGINTAEKQGTSFVTVQFLVVLVVAVLHVAFYRAL
jgi:hypothetical protein